MLVEDAWLKCTPSVSGKRVVWVGYSNDAQADVYLLDLDSGHTRRLTQNPDFERYPVLVGDRVLWTLEHDCDVIQIGPDGKEIRTETGLYLFDLKTEGARRLTDYTSPDVVADQHTALIIEGCMVGFTA